MGHANTVEQGQQTKASITSPHAQNLFDVFIMKKFKEGIDFIAVATCEVLLRI
jgi:hypothetical protein